MPVQIVEFGDYQCPACGAFANLEKPRVEEAYVESGKAQFVFYDFPLTDMHPNAFVAARAARCAADQEMFWEYHDNLFRNQTIWSPLSNPTSTFVEYAETLGLDGGDFGACLRSDRHADVVSANMQLADDQKEAFWSLCDEYQAGLRPLHERTVILIEDYAKNFYSLTDEQAKSMLDEALDIDGDSVALKKAFVKNARGKLPAKTVARYIQLENKLEAVVAYEMARQIPLVR